MVRNYRASRARRNVPSRNVNNCTSKNMNRDEAGGWERTRDAKAVGRRRLRLGEGDRAKNRRAGRARRAAPCKHRSVSSSTTCRRARDPRDSKPQQGHSHPWQKRNNDKGEDGQTYQQRGGGRAKNGGAS